MYTISKFLVINIMLFCFVKCSSTQNKEENKKEDKKESKKEYVIKGKLINFFSPKVYLEKYTGKNSIRINTSRVNSDGSFVFILPEETPVGFYKISINPVENFDIIFNNKSISFTGDASNLNESIRFTNSIENQLIYNFTKERKRYNFLLKKFAQYERTEEVLRKQFEMEMSFYNYVNDLIRKHQGTYAAKLIAINQTIHSPDYEKNFFSKEGEIMEKKYLRKHFFDNVDFMDESLINGPVLYYKIRDFFSIFLEKASNEELQKGITEIMNKAGISDRMNDFVLNIIYEFVEKLENYKVINWLIATFPYSEVCAEDIKTDMTETIEILKNISVGKPAPAFQLSNEKTQYIDLYEIESEYTLLIFWSIGCEHCINMIPRLKPVYDKYKKSGLEIIAISHDQQVDFWRNMLKQAQFKWINLNDPKGDNSYIKKAYHVVHTPKILLLDKDKNIAAKLYDYDGIVSELREKFGY